MLSPVFIKHRHTDSSLAFVPQSKILVFLLFILSLFADIYKLISSVFIEMLWSNVEILSQSEDSTTKCFQHNYTIC